ncbi:MAG: hypothetical protein NVS4B3_19430 [Gemmatimonadaceae bacterium]
MIQSSVLAEWKNGANGKLLRDLIADCIRRQDRNERSASIARMLARIPEPVRQRTIDGAAASTLLAHLEDFWEGDLAAFYTSVERQIVNPGLDIDPRMIADVHVLTLANAAERDAVLRRAAGLSSRHPWPSAVMLLYPAWAYVNVRKSLGDGPTALGYAFMQLAYVLFAAGLLAGTFRILGWRSRWTIFPTGVLIACVGLWLSNMPR